MIDGAFVMSRGAVRLSRVSRWSSSFVCVDVTSCAAASRRKPACRRQCLRTAAAAAVAEITWHADGRAGDGSCSALARRPSTGAAATGRTSRLGRSRSSSSMPLPVAAGIRRKHDAGEPLRPIAIDFCDK